MATTNLLLAQSPAFHLHAGDVSCAESGGDGLITDDYDPRAWDSYFVQSSSSAADSYEGAVDNLSSVGTYVNEAGSTEVKETVTWSHVRFTLIR